ncbi:unnamed protein product [Schistosoma mattheei]|uniref:ZP domain-containing protein n=1 Tax=Schistosoma mattheei TaxID=31246 RepID=A0AA85AU04_9TREM|nr:unnamed protein product [Schistosoma mattheei]
MAFLLLAAMHFGLVITEPSMKPSSISSVTVWPKTLFPVELGQTVTWVFSPIGGADYDVNSALSFDIGGQRAYRVQKDKCGGPLEKYFSCIYKPQNEISVTFTADESHYGQLLQVFYYKDMYSLWLADTPAIFTETIQLIKQPTFVKMSMELKEPSRYIHNVPTNLRLDPPIFLTGSNVRIDCSTDGSLPPAPISFSIECPLPPTAVVEHDRVTQAKQNLAYEVFYAAYGFRSPPTLAELAPYVARKNADQLLRLGHVSSSKDNLTLTARLTINEKAHDCHVVCRLGGKETRRILTVYYPTTISYLLPRPREGFIYVGSEITCYADGHPPPMLSLRLAQPLRPPNPLTVEEIDALRQGGRLPPLIEDDPITRELTLTNAGLDIVPQQIVPSPPGTESKDSSSVASSGTLHQVPMGPDNKWLNGNGKEPYERAHRVPGLGLSTVERHRQLGLRPDEYSIQGATFYLAPNATPGVELLLSCTARNVLPGDTTFLGLNGTITRTRFVVAVLSPTSWAVALGICFCVLLILLIIFGVMLLQKRHQNQAARNSRSTSNGAKKPKNYSKDMIAKKQPDGGALLRQGNAVNSSVTGVSGVYPTTTLTGAGLPNNIYKDVPDYTYDLVYAQSPNEMSSSTVPNVNELQYMELSFDHVRPGRNASVNSRKGRIGTSLGGGNGVASSSMTLFGTSTQPAPHSRPIVASVPQGLDIVGDGLGDNRSSIHPRDGYSSAFADPTHRDESSHYTEIVGFMQPKAHASQLVLQQQHEATQALLAMQQNKPRVFV